MKKAFKTCLFTLTKIEEILVATSIMVIAALAIANIIFRKIFNSSLTFAEELSQFLIIIVTFVGVSYATRQGRHIRMTALFDQFPKAIQKYLMILIQIVTGLLMFLLSYFAFLYVLNLYQMGRVSPALQVPIAIVYAFVPLGLFLSGIEYVLAIVKNIKNRDEIYLSCDEKLTEGHL